MQTGEFDIHQVQLLNYLTLKNKHRLLYMCKKIVHLFHSRECLQSNMQTKPNWHSYKLEFLTTLDFPIFVKSSSKFMFYYLVQKEKFTISYAVVAKKKKIRRYML